MGSDNRWELWTAPDSVATISIRGTTLKLESWIENFFAAMMAASGTINISVSQIYNYQLCSNPRASAYGLVNRLDIIITRYPSKD